jgi:predicted nucleic-acid-binding protein
MQGKQARDLFAREPEIFIAKSVVLETAWVLNSVYRFPREEIAAALRRVSGLSNVVVEDPEELSQALDFVDRGLDFADALHLAANPEAGRFYTFDKELIRRASTQRFASADFAVVEPP